MNHGRIAPLVATALLLWAVAIAWNFEAFSYQSIIDEEYRLRYVSLPRPEVVKQASLGFAAVIADLYWIGASHYYGEPRYRPSNFAQLHEYIDIINEIAPDFHEPYPFAGAAIPWNDNGKWVNTEWAVAILRRGIERFPDDWRLYFFLAYDLATYLGDFEGAGKAMEAGSHAPGGPPYLSSLSARYFVKGGNLDAAEQLTRALIDASTDENTKKVALRHLDEIAAERDIQMFEDAVKRYRATHEGKAPPVATDLDLPKPFGSYTDPLGDPYVYYAADGTFSSEHLERFLPHGLQK